MAAHRIAAFTVFLGALSCTALAQQPPGPGPASTVTLPLAEYNRLVDLAAQAAPPVNVPPVAAVLSRADLRIGVDEEMARGVFDLKGDVLRAGTHRVPIISNTTVIDARENGRTVPLVADGSSYSALLNGPAAFALTLEWAAPITLAPGRGSFHLPVPPAGSADATIDVPGEHADVRVSPGLITARSTSRGRTMVEVTLTPGSSAEVTWSIRDRAPTAPARELRTIAEVMTLITLDESLVRMAALIDVTVVQGDARTIAARLPVGYDVTSVSGSTLESSEHANGLLTVTIADPSARRHQFLVGLERPHADGARAFETGFVTVPNAQRERGEVAVEGVGTLELSAPERDGLRRIDARELNRPLASLARYPVLAAFRYQHSASPPPSLGLDVKRFLDAAVVPAVAERAVATTLVTVDGRILTEVALWIQNRAQRFMKVVLPPGASIVSVDIAGEPAKPVSGADGTRVPLLRPGFRPTGAYAVSFVYLHAGTPFAKKGEMPVVLPTMDLPVGLVEWEVFVPDRYRVKRVDGNVVSAALVSAGGSASTAIQGAGAGAGTADVAGRSEDVQTFTVTSGQIIGRATDATGAVLPGATIDVRSAGTSRQTALTDPNGIFVLSAVPSGPVTLKATLPGFETTERSLVFDQRPRQVDFVMQVAGASETVTVSAESPVLDEPQVVFRARKAPAAPAPAERAQPRSAAPSENVINLQQRAAGVLPIRVDVPRAGASHRFVKPLVVDEETRAIFHYTRR